MALVIWLPVTVASVVATCVIRFGECQVRAVLVMPAAPRARPGAALAAGAGRGIVAGLGHVQLVAQPELLALDAPAGVGVIGGGDPDMAARETVALRFL